MSRRCMITGKAVMSGHNRSHAENKTKRKFLPNLMESNIYSESLKRTVRLKISNAGLRTLDHVGGLDAFIAKTAITKLDPVLRPLKAQVEKALSEKTGSKKAAKAS